MTAHSRQASLRVLPGHPARKSTQASAEPASGDDLQEAQPLSQLERLDLSRQLHDSVAHSIAVGLQCLELSDRYTNEGNSERARVKLDTANRTLWQALEATRALSASVRTSGNASEHSPSSVSVSSDLPDKDEVFTILREAVDNALRHSEADNITIQLCSGRNSMTAVVEDDGAGIDRDVREFSSTLGLNSMNERAALLGGSFIVAPGPLNGTRVTVTLPMGASR
ncbi:Histidine kinase [Actinopolyspora lacussalsi subsp. righensis]|uniref:histidine kinase n=1 Tax=Actinopolyspora righensis TaxID=995060 RepID=A0A1I6X2V9_9ACTN|nr:Histidine kinase [Actinopolyspora righensis]